MPLTSSPQHELAARVAVALREAVPLIIAGEVDESLLLAMERLCVHIVKEAK